MVINLPKQDPPSRNAMLVCAAQAVALVCLDERAGREGFWRERLGSLVLAPHPEGRAARPQ